MKNPVLSKFLDALRFEYLKEDDSELGAVDFGVLTVAMMIAAMDGEIRGEELKSFAEMAEKCRVSRGEMAARYDAALHSAGYMLLRARSGIAEDELVRVFLSEAERVLPEGFAGGSAEDIRRALVVWVTMGLSDGIFSGIERASVKAFCLRVAEIMRKRSEDRKNSLLAGLCPALLRTADAAAGSEADSSDWLADAEAVVVSGDPDRIRSFIVNG